MWIQIIIRLKEIMEAIKSYPQSAVPDHLFTPNGNIGIYYLLKALFD